MDKKIIITMSDLDTYIELDGDITGLDVTFAIWALFDNLKPAEQILVSSKLAAQVEEL